MAVLTQREYKEKEDTHIKQAVLRETVESPVIKEKNILYVFFHPDNPMGHYLDFDTMININGKTYHIVCKNGVVKTYEKLLAEYLKNTGYILLESKEQ